MQEPPTGRIAVALVGKDPRWAGPWASAASLRHANAIQDRLQLRALMPLTTRQDDRQWTTVPVTCQVQFGRYSAPAAPERLIRRMLDPLFSSA